MKKSVVLYIIFFLVLIFSPSCKGTVNPCPIINIDDSDGVRIEFGTSTFDFGRVLLQNTLPKYFLITNKGSIDLKLTGTPKVAITGTDSGSFAIATQPASLIQPGIFSNFSILFKPTITKTYSATVVIANNSDETPFTFNLIGRGISNAEINIKQGNENIPSPSGIYDFGSVNIGLRSPTIVFTVESLGVSDLVLINSQDTIEIIGDSIDFVIDHSSTSKIIKPGFLTTFTISFKPTLVGAKSATIIIPNNDTDENPYTFTILGTADPEIVKPEINVKQGFTNIPSGTGIFDFGKVAINTSSPEVIFIIENLGNEDLLLTGRPNKIVKSGGDFDMFTVDQTTIVSTLTAGFTTFFKIAFNPTSIGAKSTTIVISNNDSDENPYSFRITGDVGFVEINVKQGSIDIPSTTGNFDFYDIKVGNSSVVTTFTIENSGDVDLLLTGNPKIEISGADAAMFTIDQSSIISPVAPSSSTTFTIVFSPTSLGAKSASISISNNDRDENPYTFTIEGFGIDNEKKIVFVIDRSGSMGSRFSPGFPVYDSNGNVISYPSRWQGCQSETALAIQALNSTDSFDVITFATQTYICFGTVMSATPNNKQMAINWVYNQHITGCTNAYDALKAGFINYGAIDSIQFMCDGYPNTALSRGCGACACSSQVQQWILQDADGWISAKVALNSNFRLLVIQMGGSPISFMTSLGAKSHATYELK